MHALYVEPAIIQPTVVCCLLFIVCCRWLFGVCCLLFVVCCVLFVVVWCVLFVVSGESRESADNSKKLDVGGFLNEFGNKIQCNLEDG